MARKVKCKNCREASCFAIPWSVGKSNYEYAKHVLNTIKQVLWCHQLNKTKPIEHEQYCKYYHKDDIFYSNEYYVHKLEKMIADYEAKMKVE